MNTCSTCILCYELTGRFEILDDSECYFAYWQLKAIQTKWVKYTLGWNFFILLKETSDDSLVK